MSTTGKKLLEMAEKEAFKVEKELKRLQLEIERSTDPDEKKQLRKEKNLWVQAKLLLLKRKTEGENGRQFGMSSVLIPFEYSRNVS
jgi:hypothetical protein